MLCFFYVFLLKKLFNANVGILSFMVFVANFSFGRFAAFFFQFFLTKIKDNKNQAQCVGQCGNSELYTYACGFLRKIFLFFLGLR